MFIKQEFIVLLIGFFAVTLNVNAAGSTINEDFSLVIEICDDMLDFAKKKDQGSFIKLAESALAVSEAQRRDNSLAIDRFRPKLRAAKKAAKSGDFDAAVGFVNEAKAYMHAAPASWDGGS